MPVLGRRRLPRTIARETLDGPIYVKAVFASIDGISADYSFFGRTERLKRTASVPCSASATPAGKDPSVGLQLQLPGRMADALRRPRLVPAAPAEILQDETAVTGASVGTASGEGLRSQAGGREAAGNA